MSSTNISSESSVCVLKRVAKRIQKKGGEEKQFQERLVRNFNYRVPCAHVNTFECVCGCVLQELTNLDAYEDVNVNDRQ